MSQSAIDRAPFGSFQTKIAALCALVAGLDGFDTQAIAYVAPSIAEDWGIVPSVFGVVFSVGLLGLMLGALILSPLADRVGRKTTILATTAIFGLCALLTAGADSVGELIALRFLTGLGLGGAMPNLIALTNEYAPARMKATLVTVMFCGFPLGSTLAGLISAPLITSYGWRSVFLVGGLLPLLLLPVLAWQLPESARFLAARRGAEPKIAKILRHILPSAPVEEFIANLRAEAPAASQSRFPVAGLFGNGRGATTLLLWLAFFMNLLVMYFLVNWLPSMLKGLGISLQTAILSAALLNLGGVFGGVVLGQMIDRRSPRVVLGSAYALAALCIAFIAFAGNSPPLLLTGAAFAGFFVVGAQIGMNALAAEIYPTAIRVTGIGWALGIGRLGSIVGPAAGGMLLGAGWAVHSILLLAVVPALVASAAVFALKATRGYRAGVNGLEK